MNSKSQMYGMYKYNIKSMFEMNTTCDESHHGDEQQILDV